MPARPYKSILARADQWFASVMQSQPENLQCGRGCSLCCHGLFEIGSGDVPIIAEGLAALHPSRRQMIVRRALEIVESSRHPNLRECSAEEKEEFFDRTESTPCPNLDESGACMIYESRPIVCRTFGLPLRDGKKYIGDICELNFKGRFRQGPPHRCVGPAMGRRAGTGGRVHDPRSDRAGGEDERVADGVLSAEY